MHKTLYSLFTILTIIFSFTSDLQAVPIAGSSSGIFTNPLGPISMQVSGVNTNHFAWGDDLYTGPGWLEFNGNEFSVETEDEFCFGTLQYFNGTISLDTHADSVDLNLTLLFTTPYGINKDYTYTLALINTTNNGDPIADSDIVNLAFVSDPNSYFTIDNLSYTLEFLGFKTITGPGYSTVDNFFVQEGADASAQLFGRITSNPNPEPVPEPATMLLLGTGLAWLAGFGKNVRKL